ncbi:MAG: hypothetical protein PVJ20_07460 [Desulfobacterales bacterium]|jgi:hypothetical protein
MKSKRIIIIFLSVAFLLGCAESFQRINNLKIGMTKQEVIEVVGAPDSTSATKNVEYLKYRINTGLFDTDEYYVRLLDGQVESYGQKGDFNLPY